MKVNIAILALLMTPEASRAFITNLQEIEQAALEPSQEFLQAHQFSKKQQLVQKEEVPDVEKDINHIARKIPILNELEKKVDQINELDPKLENLAHNLDDLTDFSDMEAAKIGGQTISAIYKVKDLPDSKVGGQEGKQYMVSKVQEASQAKLNHLKQEQEAREQVEANIKKLEAEAEAAPVGVPAGEPVQAAALGAMAAPASAVPILAVPQAGEAPPANPETPEGAKAAVLQAALSEARTQEAKGSDGTMTNEQIVGLVKSKMASRGLVGALSNINVVHEEEQQPTTTPGQLRVMAPGGKQFPGEWTAEAASEVGLLDDFSAQKAQAKFIMKETHKELAKQEKEVHQEEERIANLESVKPTSKEPVIFSTPSERQAGKTDIASRIRQGVLDLELKQKTEDLEDTKAQSDQVEEMMSKAKSLGVKM